MKSWSMQAYIIKGSREEQHLPPSSIKIIAAHHSPEGAISVARLKFGVDWKYRIMREATAGEIAQLGIDLGGCALLEDY